MLLLLPRAVVPMRSRRPVLLSFLLKHQVPGGGCTANNLMHLLPSRTLSSAATFDPQQSKQQQQQQQQHTTTRNRKNNNNNKGNNNNLPQQQDKNNGNGDNSELIRLTKRMSELDICSRREAERFIMEGRVLLKGRTVEPIHGIKVSPNETDILLLKAKKKKKGPGYHHLGNNSRHDADADCDEIQARPMEFSWDTLQTAAVVLHKPIGFVSGQPEKSPSSSSTNKKYNNCQQQQSSAEEDSSSLYTPAVRLLTPSNAHILRSNYQDSQEYQEAKNIVENLHFDYFHRDSTQQTLQNYVPAGRLDLDSSGLIIFTNQGVVAKKLISDGGKIQKEYWVVLEPLQSLTKEERALGMTSIHQLPTKPTRNLQRLRRGGYTLFGDTRPLLPVVEAEWLRWEDHHHLLLVEDDYYGGVLGGVESPSTPLLLRSNARRKLLRIVLREGRKHQIRRMCREILGMHVVQLIRTKIGSIELNRPSLPTGTWRPLRRYEIESIFLN